MTGATLPLSRATGAPWVLVGAGVAALAGVSATVVDWRAGMVGAIALIAAALIGRSEPAPTRQAAVVPGWVVTLLPAAWVTTALLPNLRLVGALTGRARRDVGAAASGDASLDVLVELTVFLVVLLGVLWLQRGSPIIELTPVVGLVLGVSGLVMLSTAWSRLPVFTLGRAIQFAALGALVTLTTWVVRAAPEHGPALFSRVTRGYVGVLLPLIAWMYVSPRHWDGRLEWPGGHPNTSGAVVGLGVVLLAARPHDRLVAALPVPNWALALALMGVELHIESRSAAAATVAAVLALFGCRGLRNSRWGALVVAGGLVGAALAVTVARDQVLDFLLREQSVGRVLGGNGRRELWNGILSEPLGNEVWGLGMGAARDLIPAAWAGDAHSAYIDLLLSLGVLGLGLVAALIAVVAVKGLLWDRPIAVGLVTYAAVLGTTATAFHEPGVELSALLLAVPLLYLRDPMAGSSVRSRVEPGATVQGRVATVGAGQRFVAPFPHNRS